MNITIKHRKNVICVQQLLNIVHLAIILLFALDVQIIIWKRKKESIKILLLIKFIYLLLDVLARMATTEILIYIQQFLAYSVMTTVLIVKTINLARNVTKDII